MLDLLRDAWPWVLAAFLLGLLCGWLVTRLWCRARRAQAADGQRAAAIDLAGASEALGFKVKANDLAVVEGIGPKIAGLLKADGITTWAALAAATPSRLKRVLHAAGPRYNIHEPATWPKQAGLLAAGKWVEFKALTDKLVGGR